MKLNQQEKKFLHQASKYFPVQTLKNNSTKPPLPALKKPSQCLTFTQGCPPSAPNCPFVPFFRPSLTRFVVSLTQKQQSPKEWLDPMHPLTLTFKPLARRAQPCPLSFSPLPLP